MPCVHTALPNDGKAGGGGVCIGLHRHLSESVTGSNIMVQ